MVVAVVVHVLDWVPRLLGRFLLHSDTLHHLPTLNDLAGQSKTASWELRPVLEPGLGAFTHTWNVGTESARLNALRTLEVWRDRQNMRTRCLFSRAPCVGSAGFAGRPQQDPFGAGVPPGFSAAHSD